MMSHSNHTNTASSTAAVEEPPLLMSLMDRLCPTGDVDNNDKHQARIRLILASQSPHRREILDMMGLAGRFEARPSPLDESLVQRQLRDQFDKEETTANGTASVDPVQYTRRPIHYTRTLAQAKARALAETLVNKDRPATTTTTTYLVLGSDTIVDLDGVILEKPVDAKDAEQTLARLAGRQHFVHTGVALYAVHPSSSSSSIQLVSSFVDTAQVSFGPLSARDIAAYVQSGEPMDKAGSYGIQGVGGQMVQSITGDFFTVMGLPMHRVSRMVAKAIVELLDPQNQNVVGESS